MPGDGSVFGPARRRKVAHIRSLLRLFRIRASDRSRARVLSPVSCATMAQARGLRRARGRGSGSVAAVLRASLAAHVLRHSHCAWISRHNHRPGIRCGAHGSELELVPRLDGAAMHPPRALVLARSPQSILQSQQHVERRPHRAAADQYLLSADISRFSISRHRPVSCLRPAPLPARSAITILHILRPCKSIPDIL